MADMLTPAQQAELSIPSAVSRGSSGDVVRRIQEWLCLNDFGVQLDGDFGPATQTAVTAFQNAKGLPADGVVSPAVFASLAAPMLAAVAPIAAAGQSLGEMLVACAQQHLAQSPVEVGGENSGPWVRLYMQGNQGAQWPWCAGFVSFCLQQAADSLGVASPLPYLFSCDRLAASAERSGPLIKGDDPNVSRLVQPGSIFLVRRSPSDWQHTGIVASNAGNTFGTVEGNSNTSGSREGYEVVANTRGWTAKDFIRVG